MQTYLFTLTYDAAGQFTVRHITVSAPDVLNAWRQFYAAASSAPADINTLTTVEISLVV